MPDNNKLKLLTIGRLSEEKGYRLLSDTCISLKKNTNLKFTWYVCGDGPMKSFLIDKINEFNLNNILVLLGHIDNPYGCLRSCDIYIQTSHLESYCLAINEAKIFQKPIISTNIPAVAEQILNYETGILCNEDVDEMVSKIIELSENHKLRNKLSNNLAKENFSHLEAVEQFNSFTLNEL